MSNEHLEIIVGKGTCGIAAGGELIYQELLTQASAGKIKSVGCTGLCHREPHIEIIDKRSEKHFFYGNLKASSLAEILEFHETVRDWVYAATDNTFIEKQTRIALRNIGKVDPASIDDYKGRRGYEAIKKIFFEKISREEIISQIKISGLRGRGGAGFPTFMKWQFAANESSSTKYFICNGDEGDPGAFMDRSLLEGDPHNIVEGMIIAAYAIGASAGYAYIRAEYPLAVRNFERAIADATYAGFLGDNILDSGFNFHLKVKQGAGAFVCGEEMALISSIEGERGMPRKRPPFPAAKGLFGKPTIINNVETISNISWIVLHGGEAYAEFGTEKAKGTKVFALAGAILHGGLVEIPMGMTIREMIYEIGGGSKSGRALKAVQLGGPSGGCIPESLFDTIIDYDAINATGAIMGSGGMIVMDESTCMVDIARYFLDFTQKESCGKCTFCRIGTLRMKEILDRIAEGQGELSDLQKLTELAEQVRATSLCGLGQTAPNPILTTLRYFRKEFEAHIVDKKCPAAVCKKLIKHSIDLNACTACTLCKRVCPVTAISGEAKKRGTFVIDHVVCINCGMCREACKFEAINVK